MRLPSRASVRLSATSSADDFAQRQLAATLHDARASHCRHHVPTSLCRSTMSSSTRRRRRSSVCAIVIAVGVEPIRANENAIACVGQLDNGACSADLFKGVWLGLAGAAAVRGSGGVEDWRPAWYGAGGYNEEPSLSHSILCATAPLAVVSRVGSGDSSVGERAVSLVLEQPSTLPSAFLHVAGTTAAVAWSHGVVQQAVTLGMTDLAIKNAMANMPADPEATWWWPVVASGTAVAPIVARAARRKRDGRR